MTDRELLELAAKASGLHIVPSEDGQLWEMEPDGLNGGPWNPLTEDGDALRLAVELKISIDLYADSVEAMDSCKPFRIGHDTFHNNFVCIEDAAPDYAESVRRAIVRAAAEIGKALP